MKTSRDTSAESKIQIIEKTTNAKIHMDASSFNLNKKKNMKNYKPKKLINEFAWICLSYSCKNSLLSHR